ncbi:hypothetical protein BVG19_g1760 [[Candida] boidinii]|nr:hypothetical protein BVG19_g1760 [[Candida] boidinii]OWB48775.1 hypothetical protein B5S27_g310 [[Candida] boidinii]
MNWSHLFFELKKPFVNLTPRAKLLQRVRFISLFVTIILIACLTGVQFISYNLYIARLDCTHVDVSNGLFKALKSSVNFRLQNIDDSNRSGDTTDLTASEIAILSKYTEEQVQNAPQFIYSNLMNWCFGSYESNLKQEGDSYLEEEDDKKITFIQCTARDNHYVFDYRGELSTIGLNIILSYAYGTTDSLFSDEQAITSNSEYIPDSGYLTFLKYRRRATSAIPLMLFFSVGINTAMIALGLVYYANRGFAKDDHSMPGFIKHIFGLLSLVSFILILVAVSLTTTITTSTKMAVQKELGDFGLSVHLGTDWFSVAWVTVAASTIAFLSWGGSFWCGHVEQRTFSNDENYLHEREYIGTPMKKRVGRTLRLDRFRRLGDNGDDDDDSYGKSSNGYDHDRDNRSHASQPKTDDIRHISYHSDLMKQSSGDSNSINYESDGDEGINREVESKFDPFSDSNMKNAKPNQYAVYLNENKDADSIVQSFQLNDFNSVSDYGNDLDQNHNELGKGNHKKGFKSLFHKPHIENHRNSKLLKYLINNDKYTDTTDIVMDESDNFITSNKYDDLKDNNKGGNS